VSRRHLPFNSVIGLDLEYYEEYQDHAVVLLVKLEGESDSSYSIVDSLCGIELKTCDSACRLMIKEYYDTIGFQHESGSRDAVVQAAT